MYIEQLANYLAQCMNKDDVGMAERGVISGSTVVTDTGSYYYEAACPIDLYTGKQVWVQVAEDGTAVIIGD